MVRGMVNQGVFRYAKGDMHEGGYKDDQRHGQGVCRFANGDVCEGDFKDGLMHGRGVYRCANGSIAYDGQWKAGLPVN